MAVTITKKENGFIEATSDTSKYIVVIDRDTCVGAATCVAVAGQTFDMDGESKVVVLEGDWDSDEMILAGAQSCPVFAISIIDKETGLKVFPAD
jgi:ferredoxin